jgi:hypothetical protein
MKRLAISLSLALLGVSAALQAETIVVNQTFSAQADQIVLTAPDDVVLVYNPSRAGNASYAIDSSVKGQPLKFTTDGTTLTISRASRDCDPRDVTVYYGRPIRLIRVSSSGEIEAETLHAASNVEFAVTGSGDIEITTVNASNVSINVKSSGDVEIKNLKATSAALTLTGSGDIEVGTLSAKSAAISLASSGDISISSLAATTAAITLSGSGEIKVKNSKSTSLSAQASGSGDLSIKGSTSALSLTADGTSTIAAHSLRSTSASVVSQSSAASIHVAAASKAMNITASGVVNVKGSRPKLLTINGKTSRVTFKE